jgi:excisionase family DNA binding protein
MEKLLTLKQVSEHLNTSWRTLMRWIKDRKLPASKIGGRWMVREGDVELYIKRRLFFFEESALPMLYFRPEVLEQYRKSPGVYYVNEAAFHGRVGKKEDRFYMHQERSLSKGPKWSKNAFGKDDFNPPDKFAELYFWKTMMLAGEYAIVVDPRSFSSLPEKEQKKWHSYQIHKPIL